MHQGKDVQSPGDARAEADPTSKVRGPRFQQNLVVKSHNSLKRDVPSFCSAYIDI